jgi:exopolysaccharide production protein ExoQ
MIKKIFAGLEYSFAILSLILFTGGILDIIAIDGFSEGDGKLSQLVSANEKIFAIKQFVFYIVYTISFLLLARNTNKSTKISTIIFQNIYIVFIVGLAFFSTMWSDLPALTISRSIALAGTTIFGIYIANRYTLKEKLVLLKHTFIAIILLSIAFAIAVPQYGVMGGEVHAGAWRGIYTHKNEFARIIALGGIIFLMQPKPEKPNLNTRSIGKLKQSVISKIKSNIFLNHLFTILCVGSSILLIMLSTSSGGIVILANLTIVFGIFKIGQLRSSQRFIAMLGALVLFAIYAVVVLPNPESIFASLGKSSDLTGRWDIWKILFEMLSDRPLLGFGYGAFWEKHGAIVALAAAWETPHAHNGFIDLALSIGYLGLALFVFSYCYIFIKCLARFRDTNSDETIYPMIILIYIVLSNISESGLFSYNYIYWLLYVIVGYSTTVGDLKIPIVGKPISTENPQPNLGALNFRGKSKSLDALAFRMNSKSLDVGTSSANDTSSDR